jgi:3-oxoacyl-[acyl-carrier protein] reductase
VTEFQEQIVLVTGSSRGIGRAIAIKFAAADASVVLHGRDLDALESVKKEIDQSGGRSFVVNGDLTHSSEIEDMRNKIEGELGPVDVLVANAGGNPVKPGLLEEISEEGFKASIDANLTSTFLTIRAFLPGMKERGRGAIITMSSAASRRPTVQSPIAYGAAKAGIELITKELAAQAGPYGIRVNCIAPETIMTDRNNQQIPEGMRDQMIKNHPIQRLGTPEDVADAAVFLASDQSSWITGITIDVAGGSVLV